MRVLVLGATSSISRAISAQLAKDGHDLILAARSPSDLARLAGDIQTRFGRQVQCLGIEALEFDTHLDFVSEVTSKGPGLDAVIFSIGYMGPQPESSDDPEEARKIIDVNLTAAVSLLGRFANYFANRKSGTIIAISSVAGERGRKSNYAYGAAKGGLSLYLQGLRNRLDREGVYIHTVNPGFVDTAMTWGLPGLFLVASPEQIATNTCRLIGQPGAVHFFPWFWRWIMLIIRLIPERIFKKLSL